ncbi:LysR substrate-binding domain-containing protein, partial [Klebsiella pneumoniae]
SAARTEADVMVLTRRQDITGRGEWLMNIDFIAVAHRDHPLAALDGPLEDSALAPWPLVRIADQGGDSQAPRDAWTFSTIDAAIDAVMYQVGFGWLPEERIRPHLDQGVLKRLPLSHGARRATPLHLIVKRDLAPIDEQVATLLALFRTP